MEPVFDEEAERQRAAETLTVLPIASLRQLPGWRAATEDLAAGRLWKARDRLQGLIRTFPLNVPDLAVLMAAYCTA